MDFGTVPKVWYFCFIFLLDLGTVPTVWYFLFYFSVVFWNCSDSVVFFVLFFYWILDLFWQRGIFCFIFLVDLGTVPMVWYFLFFFLLDLGTVLTVRYFLFYFSNGYRNCSDGAIFFALFFHWILELFRQCGIFCFVFLMDLGTVPIVWYFMFYFFNGSKNCSDGVVFFVLFFYWI